MSAQLKATPGPWFVAPDDPECVVHREGARIDSSHRMREFIDCNSAANARLIAQAPAYAAATQPVVDNLVGQDDTPDDDFIPVRAGDLRALNEAHLKAIGQ